MLKTIFTYQYGIDILDEFKDNMVKISVASHPGTNEFNPNHHDMTVSWRLLAGRSRPLGLGRAATCGPINQRAPARGDQEKSRYQGTPGEESGDSGRKMTVDGEFSIHNSDKILIKRYCNAIIIFNDNNVRC